MYCKFSLFFCLYIQNELNLFLLTAKYIYWRKKKNKVSLSFCQYHVYFCDEKREKTDIKTSPTTFTL
ncbi:hypothetical protein DWZ75_05180 [Bacteroides stercoris]|uniref:Uncharacterized protein n=1 Tax=Bacteroides stercoris TaxID=46506 RepID=A0A415PR07_BACSE|nr:hypothetical protein DWZ78_16970 [Bacteroides stercoris]RHM23518.1 hypothetical protein DWZ75_05180 [Bacteroides stercoris]